MALEEVKESTTEFDKMIERVDKTIKKKYNNLICVGAHLYMMNELLNWRKEQDEQER